MLFHSPAFIFAFLPICFLGFVLIHRFWGWERALSWLAAASIFFYGQWSLALAALLTGSILTNYAVVRVLLAKLDQRRLASSILMGAIAANLSLLAYFKYANFFIDNIDALLGPVLSHIKVILPIGISFYTFIQIGFLIETYNGQVKEVSFTHYFLFGSFFPCVTAGPIILQKEMMRQFAAPRAGGVDVSAVAVGLTVFGIGLFKKLVLADNIAPFADAVFDGAAAGAVATTTTAWIGALAYTLQLYFDFSGYSDMALGIGQMFGLKLPLNFNSPLKACSITDFWRRWHMTMTRFFTNYLYSPIAMRMMRRALQRSYGPRTRFLAVIALPVTATFVLAGLWHGAGWTFIVFGLIHGLALATNHAWREARMPALSPLAGWLLTMGVVVLGLVFFRAASVPVALSLLASMIGLGADTAAAISSEVAVVGVDAFLALAWIVVLGTIALTCPNSQEIMRHHWFSSDPEPESGPKWLVWQPTVAWGLVGAIALAAALGSMSGDTAFLYYQF
ncbi:MAG TPA: MBOAT family O-acyltransferase [Geminicoccaceae bacterium]|nr:MBOAT family O-acyltransferase [Geminicoccaceae bacterium]